MKRSRCSIASIASRPATSPGPTGRDARAVPTRDRTGRNAAASGTHILTLLLVLAIGLTLGALVMIYWNAWVPVSVARTPIATFRYSSRRALVPRAPAAEVALARAHTLQANGKLREALAALDAIRQATPFSLRPTSSGPSSSISCSRRPAPKRSRHPPRDEMPQVPVHQFR